MNPAQMIALVEKLNALAPVISHIETLDADKDGVPDLQEAKALVGQIMAEGAALHASLVKLAALAEADAKALGIEVPKI